MGGEDSAQDNRRFRFQFCVDFPVGTQDRYQEALLLLVRKGEVYEEPPPADHWPTRDDLHRMLLDCDMLHQRNCHDFHDNVFSYPSLSQHVYCMD